MQELLLNPIFHFIVCGLTTNAIVGIVSYNLGRRNPSNEAASRISHEAFRILVRNPELYETVRELYEKISNSTTPNP